MSLVKEVVNMSQMGSETYLVAEDGVSDGCVNLNGESSERESHIGFTARDQIRRKVDRDVMIAEPFLEESGNSCNQYDSCRSDLTLGYGFHIGDMVWGRVKSHPWWPGHIYNEALASSSVRRTKRYGHVLVAFFGDSSYGWFGPDELIPFDANFSEKSHQTTTRGFLKAVEEAVDEASRRSGLGVLCKCRNPCNFRPSSIEGHVAVDVPDYEAGGIYSWSQIEKARERFRPPEILSFVKRLAVTSQITDHSSIEWIKDRATVFAYRKAVFEEFDETYAEAFGMQPVKSPDQKSGANNQSAKGPSRAPLSGRMVVAETVGSGKSVTLTKTKSKDQSKKDRYVFKRREEPECPDSEKMCENLNPPTPIAYIEGTSMEGAEDFVLQKITPDQAGNGDFNHVTASNEETEVNESTQLIRESADDVSATNHEHQQELEEGLGTVLSKIKQSKLAKQASKPVSKRKRKKVGDSTVDLDEQPERSEEPAISMPPISLEGVELQGLMSNLEALGVDHFFDAEGSRTAKYCFLRFRSVVYQKSLVVPRVPEGDSVILHETKPEGNAVEAEIATPPPPRPPARPQIRLDDPTRGGQKRNPSERLEEMAAKRVKKINEKKASLKREEVKTVAVKKAEPTMLVMKFTPFASLPSIPELKARFARFGPLDHSATRVFWKTYTCRIVFVYKADAYAAYKYAEGNGSIFGDVKYYVKEMASEVNEIKAPALQQQPVQLKSCLKRSNEDGGGCPKGGGGGYPKGGGGGGSQRVKFVLGAEERGRGDVDAAAQVGTDLQFCQFGNDSSVPQRREADISQQMLGLLTRCHDVVMHVRTALGYTPYRAL